MPSQTQKKSTEAFQNRTKASSNSQKPAAAKLPPKKTIQKPAAAKVPPPPHHPPPSRPLPTAGASTQDSRMFLNARPNSIAQQRIIPGSTALPKGSKKRSHSQALGKQAQAQNHAQPAKRASTIIAGSSSNNSNAAGGTKAFNLGKFCETNNAYSNKLAASAVDPNVAAKSATAAARAASTTDVPARAPPAYQARSQHVAPKTTTVTSSSDNKSGSKPSVVAKSNESRGYQLSKTPSTASNGVAPPPPPLAKTNSNSECSIAENEARSKRQAERKKVASAAVMSSSRNDLQQGRDKLVAFPADTDVPKKSSALNKREELSAYFAPKQLKEAQASYLASRITKWDPYWKVERYISCGMTAVGKPTGIAQMASLTQKWLKEMPMGVAWCPFQIQPSDIQGMKASDWGTEPPSRDYTDGQKRLILRMIPAIPDTKKRADYHVWPKGSFVVANGLAVTVDQRKQQAHDPKYWSGLSRALDLTPHIRKPTESNIVKVLTYDDEHYFFCITLCSFVSPATLYKNLATAQPGNDSALLKLTRKASTAIALRFTKQDTVILESDDEDEDVPAPVDDSLGKFVFTLTCPFSKATMEKPVRGKNCKHFQCFDLSNFLNSNAAVYGQRWRCLVCEDNLKCEDLEICGLTEDLIFEFRKELVPTVRDRIEYSSDKSYRLLENRKKRYGKKPASNSSGTNTSAPVSAEPEIIMLD